MKTQKRGDGAALAAIAIGAALALAWSPALWSSRSHAAPASAPRTSVTTVAPPSTSVTATPAAEPSAAAPAGVAFYASSLGDGWSFEGDYAGRLTRDASGLEVDLPTALVRRESADGAPTHLVGIALALADYAGDGEQWTIVRQGPLHLATDATHDGADLWMRGVRLRLDGVTDADLEGRWLVIVQQLEVEDATGSHPAWTYAHADKALLTRLMGGQLDGC